MLTLCALAAVLAQDSGTVPVVDALPKADAAVTRTEIEHHVSFMASDELLGRPAFSAESRRVARYLASALERAGLQPGASDGTFFQEVPFLRTSYSAPHECVLTDGDGGELSLALGSQFDLRVRGELNLGTFVVQHVGSEADVPEPDAGVALVLHTSASKARRWLPDGGVGFGLVVVDTGRKERRAKGVPRDSVRPNFGEPRPDAPEEVQLFGELASKAAEQAVSIEVRVHGGPVKITDPNVVGRIQGVGTPEHPELADEVIVLSAHFDHVGTTKDPKEAEEGEDVIKNGADDDASGVAALLEIAEFLAARPAPARTVIVLLATAEERGILGTKYFVQEPPVALESIVCNLNFEMLGRPDPTVGGAGKLWLSGYERSSLGEAFGSEGLDVKPDMRPDQNFFGRSDNIVFVKVGIVGQTLSSYNMHGDYHGVADDAAGIDFDHMLGATQAALEATRMLCDGRITPTWKKGEPKGYLR